jgi:DNA-binding HxlR family transcriptional regulator
MKPHYGCPIKATANALGGKWKVLIVWQLFFGRLRFAGLRDLLPGISEKVLTDQLRQLEKDGIVRRTVTPTVPQRVDYELTAAGNELIPVMQSMCDWGEKNLGVAPNYPLRVPAAFTE